MRVEVGGKFQAASVEDLAANWHGACQKLFTFLAASIHLAFLYTIIVQYVQ